MSRAFSVKRAMVIKALFVPVAAINTASVASANVSAISDTRAHNVRKKIYAVMSAIVVVGVREDDASVSRAMAVKHVTRSRKMIPPVLKVAPVMVFANMPIVIVPKATVATIAPMLSVSVRVTPVITMACVPLVNASAVQALLAPTAKRVLDVRMVVMHNTVSASSGTANVRLASLVSIAVCLLHALASLVWVHAPVMEFVSKAPVLANLDGLVPIAMIRFYPRFVPRVSTIVPMLVFVMRAFASVRRAIKVPTVPLRPTRFVRVVVRVMASVSFASVFVNLATPARIASKPLIVLKPVPTMVSARLGVVTASWVGMVPLAISPCPPSSVSAPPKMI